MRGLVMTDPFHCYRRTGTWRNLWLFSLTWSGSSVGWTLLLLSILIFLNFFLRLLSIVYGDIESNPGQGSDKRVRVLYSNIRSLHANLDELTVVMFWFGLSLKSLIAAISPSSVSLALVAPNNRLRNFTPGAQGMALYVREGFRFFRQSIGLFLPRVLCVLYLQ